MGIKNNSRRGNNKAASGWIKKDKRLSIYLRDRFTCLLCLRDLHDADPRDITLDHVKAQSEGGTHHESNLYTCCRTCNCGRQDKPLARVAGPETRAHIKRNTRRKLTTYRKLAKALIAGEVGFEETLKSD